MIHTATGRKSRLVVSQLWLLGAQAVTLFAWVGAVVTPTWAPVVHGLLGSIQAISAIMLRQTTDEPMAKPKKRTGLVGFVLGVVWLGLSGCATTFDCASDVRVELHDKAVVVKCLDGSAPTVTVTAVKVVGP